MVQWVDHSSECENMTVLRSRVQFSFMSLFCVCQISHGHVIYNLIWWSRNGSTRNLVRLVGIHLEFGQNLVGMILSLSEICTDIHSYQIPTIPTILLGFCLDSYHSARIWSECVGEGKVLTKCWSSHANYILGCDWERDTHCCTSNSETAVIFQVVHCHQSDGYWWYLLNFSQQLIPIKWPGDGDGQQASLRPEKMQSPRLRPNNDVPTSSQYRLRHRSTTKSSSATSYTTHRLLFPHLDICIGPWCTYRSRTTGMEIWRLCQHCVASERHHLVLQGVLRRS